MTEYEKGRLYGNEEERLAWTEELARLNVLHTPDDMTPEVALQTALMEFGLKVARAANERDADSIYLPSDKERFAQGVVNAVLRGAR